MGTPSSNETFEIFNGNEGHETTNGSPNYC
jgi:hypothetical protein